MKAHQGPSWVYTIVLLCVVVAAPAHSVSLRWDVTFLDATAQREVGAALAPGLAYVAWVRVVGASGNSGHTPALALRGLFPRVQSTSSPLQDVQLDFTKCARPVAVNGSATSCIHVDNPSKAGWYFSVTMPSLPGLVDIVVVQSTVISNLHARAPLDVGLPNFNVADTSVIMRISGAIITNSSDTFALGSRVTPSTAPVVDRLTLSCTPRVSTTCVVVYSNSSQVIVSDSDFQQQVHINISDSVCGASGDVSVLLSLPYRTIAVKNGTLSQGTRSSSSQALDWTCLLQSGVDYVFSPTSLSQARAHADLLLVSTFTGSAASTVFLSTNTSSPLVELADGHGRTLHGRFNTSDYWSPSARVLQMSASPTYVHHFLLLVDHSNVNALGTSSATVSSLPYGLYTFSFAEETVSVAGQSHIPTGYSQLLNTRWDARFLFPSMVPVTDGRPSVAQSALPHRRLWNASGGSGGGAPLRIHGMSCGGKHGVDLFVWGSAVLYSPDWGRSFYRVHTFSHAVVEQFVSSSDGTYIALTNTSELWLGQAGVLRFVRFGVYTDDSRASLAQWGLSPLPAVTAVPLRTLLVDARDRLFMLSLVMNGTTPHVFRSRELSGLVMSTVSSTLVALDESCPFKEVQVVAPRDSFVTRETLALLDRSRLPAAVFLDVGAQYSFSVLVYGHSANDPLVHLGSALLSESPTVSVTADPPQFIQPGVVGYTFTVRDLASPLRSLASGYNMSTNVLQLSFSNSSLGCTNTQTMLPVVDEDVTTSFTAPSLQLPVMSGCPPRLRWTFDATASRNEFESCDASEVPCFSFTNDFTPQLRIVDDVTMVSEPYIGTYKLRFVGGGTSKDSIHLFSVDQQESFNQGRKSIWTSLNNNQSDNILHTGATITWVCAQGSPCGDVHPSWPHAPEYYFLVEMATETPAVPSYCKYRIQFVLRVHGLSLNLLSAVWVALFSAAVLLAGVSLSFLCCWAKYDGIKDEINATFSDSDEEDLYYMEAEDSHAPLNPRSVQDTQDSSQTGASVRQSTFLSPVARQRTSSSVIGVEDNKTTESDTS